jgi:hypothetical protein
MDETYIKVKGRWCYYYRAIYKFGDTLDFMLSKIVTKYQPEGSSSDPLRIMACLKSCH